MGGAMDRRLRLWTLIVNQAGGRPITVESVCAVALSATAMDGAAVVLFNGSRQLLFATNETAADLEDLVLTIGEGPGIDSPVAGPSLVPDLSTIDSLARWPAFAPAALQAGAGAVFALPLRIGAIRLGVLNLYRARPADLHREHLADALVLADTICALILDGHSSPAGSMPPEVHQATGMVLVQLGVTAVVALTRLRAYAFVHDRRLHDVARDVINRRLRFTLGE
jgi:hypothetical protein